MTLGEKVKDRGMLRSILGGPATLEDAEAAERATIEERVRVARVTAARGNSRWEEIEADFVPRGRKGYWLVSASTDHVYTRARGTVFPTASAAPVANFTALYFTVDADGELTFYERQPWKWSEHIANHAAREARRNAPRTQRRR